jgi:hypothetical protein
VAKNIPARGIKENSRVLQTTKSRVLVKNIDDKK